ncbi:lyase family protein [Kitasatospora sp. NPDC002040]|uniref:lyase family protein n=1 Tax=Kitasatospora sp. NPDC002040 TaxID=3154661 RepID=UPI0033291268
MRTDEDMLGSIELPDHLYYGVHTERGRQNYDVSGPVLGDFPHYVSALAQVKKAAALANADVGVIDREVAEAIGRAADEVVAGRFGREQYPVNMLNAGAMSVNMNLNEVLANRANELLTGRIGHDLVHPNNHVNAGQSTTDAITTAMLIALHHGVRGLVTEVRAMEEVLAAKAERYRHAVKPARTCLQDSVPVTFGQSFGAYLAVARRGIERLEAAADRCLDVPMGATVVGTGLGVGAGYLERIFPRLREATGLALRRHPDSFDCVQNGDVYLHLSATFKALATNLSKIARDLRLLAGSDMREITLPAVQAGSSYTPGKVNPVIPELVIQVAYQVCGNDTAVTMGVEGAELEANVWLGLITKNLFESCALLTGAVPLFTQRCLAGIEVNEETALAHARSTLALSAVVGSVHGYEAGVRAALHAKHHGTTIGEAVVELGIMSPQAADALFDPLTLTDPTRSPHLVDELTELERRRVTALFEALPLPVRHRILHAVTVIAEADGRITNEEDIALRMIGRALGVAPGADRPAADGLSSEHRSLVYTCAVWTALVDDEEDATETRQLELLQAELGLDQAAETAARRRVEQVLARRRALLPRSEELPWWEQFEALITTEAVR